MRVSVDGGGRTNVTGLVSELPLTPVFGTRVEKRNRKEFIRVSYLVRGERGKGGGGGGGVTGGTGLASGP